MSSDNGGGEGRTAAGKARRGVLEAEATVRLRRERRRRAGREEEEEPEQEEKEVDSGARGSILGRAPVNAYACVCAAWVEYGLGRGREDDRTG